MAIARRRPCGADHRHRAGEVDLLFVVAALERAGRAANDLGGEDDVLRDPAGDVDRRVALVAQRLHQLRDHVRRARQQAGAQRVGGDHLVEPLHQVLDDEVRQAGRAAIARHADDPAEELDPLRIGAAAGTSSGRARRRRNADEPAEEADVALVVALRRDRSTRAVRASAGARPASAPRGARSAARSAGASSARAPSRQRRGAFGSVDAAGRGTALASERIPPAAQRHGSSPEFATGRSIAKGAAAANSARRAQPIACSTASQSGAVTTKASVETTIAVLVSAGSVS